LTGKERIEALQKLSDRATDFTQALLEKDADFKQAQRNLNCQCTRPANSLVRSLIRS
jgi:hypothetical protein